jgi:hypothetical protein
MRQLLVRLRTIRLTPSQGNLASAGLALVAPLVAAALLVLARGHVTNTALALVMVAVVVVVVTPGRRLAALVAGVSAGLWFDFFLTRPYESFAVSRSADLQTTVLLVVVAVAVGELAARDRQHRADDSTSIEGLAALQTVAQLLAEGAAVEAVLGGVGDALTALLRLDTCRFEADGGPVKVPYVDRPGYVSYSIYRWDTSREGLPVGVVTLPVEYDGRRLGRFLMQGPFPGLPIRPQALSVAVTLGDLAGLALARARGRPTSNGRTSRPLPPAPNPQ